MIRYIVRCEFDERAVRDRFAAWLQEEHCADVCRAGALDAELVLLDGDTLALEVRYTFASRESFAKYEAEEAPRLRAEGLRIKGDAVVRFVRSTGEIILQTKAM